MGCILVVIALAVPRLLMVGLFLLTDWFGQAFETTLWPVLGFLFMPYTTLAYMAAMFHNDHSVSGAWLVLVIVAVLVDMGHWGGGHRGVTGRSRRKRR
jgi:hypothetical protein